MGVWEWDSTDSAVKCKMPKASIGQLVFERRRLLKRLKMGKEKKRKNRACQLECIKLAICRLEGQEGVRHAL
jgi:hypothetical protein